VKRAGEKAREQVYLRETHFWYQLDLDGERPHADMPEGIALVEAGADEVPLIDQLPSLSVDDAEKRRSEGASLWLALEDRKPAFACWIFLDRLPVLASESGSLALPEEAVALEDSITSPDFRGRGVAPRSWSTLADRLAERGFKAMITKVGEENEASRKAVKKSGFREVAVMRAVRLGGRFRVEVEQLDGGLGPYLAEQLER
jgi:ribosomal protein S18 acetylase RimI-like enzyme